MIDKKGVAPQLVILGKNGMLGSMVMRYFMKQNIPFYAACRKDFEAGVSNLREFLNRVNCQSGTYVLNCIGIVNRRIESTPLSTTVRINSLFPHELAECCHAMGLRLIHVSTDCVFSGKEGGYTESSPLSAQDTYGMSKALGEPASDSMVIRSSFVGPEIENFYLLLSWVLAQEGRTISGYVNHLWNGITSFQFAKVVRQIVVENRYDPGLFHVYSPSVVSKSKLIEITAKAFGIKVQINPVKAKDPIDRSMRSEKPFCEQLRIPSLETQLSEIASLWKQEYRQTQQGQSAYVSSAPRTS